ncbi:MAG: hypothetical protein KJ592_02575 [Nanoarchaeota archaeon]|nr:hypothetical protein [Nanoarchaeota archaeon]
MAKKKVAKKVAPKKKVVAEKKVAKKVMEAEMMRLPPCNEHEHYPLFKKDRAHLSINVEGTSDDIVRIIHEIIKYS